MRVVEDLQQKIQDIIHHNLHHVAKCVATLLLSPLHFFDFSLLLIRQSYSKLLVPAVLLLDYMFPPPYIK